MIVLLRSSQLSENIHVFFTLHGAHELQNSNQAHAMADGETHDFAAEAGREAAKRQAPDARRRLHVSNRRR